MSDYSIYFSKKNKEVFLSFWKRFEEKVNLFYDVSIDNQEEKIGLKFSIPTEDEIVLKKLVKIWLSNSLVVYFKKQYFLDNLILPSNIFINPIVFCTVLAIFDKSTDIDFVISKLVLTPEFDVDSFYYFKLSELRLRWQEVCDLIEHNLPSLISSNAFFELIKYLLTITETECDKVNVVIDNKSITIYESNSDSEIFKDDVMNDNSFLNLILELITIAPNQITFKGENLVPNEFISSIKNLFGTKLVFFT